MEKRYYFVGDGTLDGPRKLPRSWRNISNLDTMSDPELMLVGFLPEVRVGFDLPVSATEVKEGPSEVQGISEVTATWTVRNKTQPELDQDVADQEARKDAVATAEFDSTRGRLLFNQENRIRVLEGRQAVSAADYIAFIRGRV